MLAYILLSRNVCTACFTPYTLLTKAHCVDTVYPASCVSALHAHSIQSDVAYDHHCTNQEVVDTQC